LTDPTNDKGIPDLTTQASAIAPPQRDAVGVAFVLLSGLGVVFLPTTAKFAYLDGSNVLTVVFARGLVAVVLMMLVALTIRQSLKMPTALLQSSLIAGVAQVFFVYGLYAAITSINISLAVLILYLFPIVLAVHQRCKGTIQVNPAQWLCALATCAGLALILGVRVDQISLHGVALALMAMLATVVMTISNVRVTATVGALISNLYMSLWSLLILGLALWVVGEVSEPQSTLGWIALGSNGIAYCIAYVSFFAGARILGATRASMLSLVEPPAAAFGAWLLFGENFSALQWVGFCIVLAAIFGFEKLSRPPA
jgi:drug/metabolite transporter (DMT)-like permease